MNTELSDLDTEKEKYIDDLKIDYGTLNLSDSGLAS